MSTMRRDWAPVATAVIYDVSQRGGPGHNSGRNLAFKVTVGDCLLERFTCLRVRCWIGYLALSNLGCIQNDPKC